MTAGEEHKIEVFAKCAINIGGSFSSIVVLDNGGGMGVLISGVTCKEVFIHVSWCQVSGRPSLPH